MLGPQVVNYTHLTATAISARACPNSALTFEHDSFFFCFFFLYDECCLQTRDSSSQKNASFLLSVVLFLHPSCFSVGCLGVLESSVIEVSAISPYI